MPASNRLRPDPGNVRRPVQLAYASDDKRRPDQRAAREKGLSRQDDVREFNASVGDLSEQFGLTPRAIRFYEEVGLIRSRRDQLNWRRYGVEARRRLALIVALRAAGVPLDEIRRAIESTEDCEDAQRWAIRTSLERRLASLDDERAKVLAQLETVRGAGGLAPVDVAQG